jgi:hypothetical protein
MKRGRPIQSTTMPSIPISTLWLMTAVMKSVTTAAARRPNT